MDIIGQIGNIQFPRILWYDAITYSEFFIHTVHNPNGVINIYKYFLRIKYFVRTFLAVINFINNFTLCIYIVLLDWSFDSVNLYHIQNAVFPVHVLEGLIKMLLT